MHNLKVLIYINDWKIQNTEKSFQRNLKTVTIHSLNIIKLNIMKLYLTCRHICPLIVLAYAA